MTWQAFKDHCKSGHPFDEQNTRVDARTGKRSCIECGRIRSREYQRRKRAQSPDLLAWTRDLDLYNCNARERFEANYEVNSVTGCWLWTAGTNSDGYGNFWYLGETVGAHRAAWYFLVGEVESGLHLDHLCRVRNCVNPEHLDPVPPRVNILRGTGEGAVNAVKTHCIRGHELTGDNLVPSGVRKGRRFCQICMAEHYPSKVNRGRGSGGVATASPSPSTEPQEVQP